MNHILNIIFLKLKRDFHEIPLLINVESAKNLAHLKKGQKRNYFSHILIYCLFSLQKKNIRHTMILCPNFGTQKPIDMFFHFSFCVTFSRFGTLFGTLFLNKVSGYEDQKNFWVFLFQKYVVWQFLRPLAVEFQQA